MFKDTTGQEAIISRDDVDLFNQSIEPLVKYQKLGALLAQFPPSFKNDDYGQQILSAVMGAFKQYRLAVELRHRSWSDDNNTSQLLRNNDVTWVQIDEPKFVSSVAEELPLTSDIAYFRFHGRNKEMWWKGNSETRYKYLYSDEEISELADRVKQASRNSQLTFAFFNNHWQGYAPRNATGMMKRLEMPAKDIPTRVGSGDDESQDD